MIYSCDLDNPFDLLGDKKKKKRIDGEERIDSHCKKVTCKMQKNYKSFYFLSLICKYTISLAMLD